LLAPVVNLERLLTESQKSSLLFLVDFTVFFTNGSTKICLNTSLDGAIHHHDAMLSPVPESARTGRESVTSVASGAIFTERRRMM
jgi:hypothetical protein